MRLICEERSDGFCENGLPEIKRDTPISHWIGLFENLHCVGAPKFIPADDP